VLSPATGLRTHVQNRGHAELGAAHRGRPGGVRLRRGRGWSARPWVKLIPRIDGKQQVPGLAGDRRRRHPAADEHEGMTEKTKTFKKRTAVRASNAG